MKRPSVQRLVTLAMEVLDKEAYRSSRHRVDTMEVRLALAVLWLVMRERAGLRAYWTRAQREDCAVWDTCRESYRTIAFALREEGWEAST